MKARKLPRSGPTAARVLALMAGCAVAGCAPAVVHVNPIPAAQGASTPRLLSSPLQPEDVDPRDDAVVRIVITTGEKTADHPIPPSVSCTGTLIADDLVLTAHHCVSKRDNHGRVMHQDVGPESLSVQLGGDDFAFAEVHVRALVTPDCGYAEGDGDLAILVLTRKLVGMPTWSPRLDAPPRVGEKANTLGFGKCGGAEDGLGRHKVDHGKDNDNRDRVAKVTPGRVIAQGAICPGDSGGPVFDSSNNTSREIIGVVSMSVMDDTGPKVGDSYFTRVDVWPQLFSAAREIADGASPSELPPFRSCERQAVTK